MANVMDLKKVRNHVSRNGFDLSERKCFTAKVGEILPVWVKEVIPGDSFDIKVQSFTRTQPVNTAAYTRIKEYYDYFFVPYRLLWRYYDQFITQTTSSNSQFANSIVENSDYAFTNHPYIVPDDLETYLKAVNDRAVQGENDGFNAFGFNRANLSCKLLRYLGLGVLKYTPSSDETGKDFSCQIQSQNAINPFPILAYQKICQDYYRNTQWQKANPSSYNIDYMSNQMRIPLGNIIAQSTIPTNLFDLNYCSWNKDLFTGVLPSPQYGDAAIIGDINVSDVLTGDLDASGRIIVNDGNGQFNAVQYDQSTRIIRYNNNSSQTSPLSSDSATLDMQSTFTIDATQLSQISVLALRQAEALQKWKEISITGQQDYKDQIEKHFGVSVPSSRSNMCEWLGGSSDNLDITEIVNTNLTGLDDGTSQADIAGKGVGSLGGNIHFENKGNEHGLLLCIYHAVPLLDYMDSVTMPLWFKSNPWDYAIPEFDSVGMQSLPAQCLDATFDAYTKNPGIDYKPTQDYTAHFNSLGYVPRYADYKTSVDTVTGAFTDTLKYWTSALGTSYWSTYWHSLGPDATSIDYNFFNVNPACLNTIFAVNASSSWNTDNLLINSFSDVKVVRNLDYNGLPY